MSPNVAEPIQPADYYYRYLWFRLIFGNKSVQQLRASNSVALEEIQIPKCEFGIIAGTKGDGKNYRNLFSVDNDGIVSLESTKLIGAKDFITLRHRHMGLIFAKDTCENVLSFLKLGEFIH